MDIGQNETSDALQSLSHEEYLSFLQSVVTKHNRPEGRKMPHAAAVLPLWSPLVSRLVEEKPILESSQNNLRADDRRNSSFTDGYTISSPQAGHYRRHLLASPLQRIHSRYNTISLRAYTQLVAEGQKSRTGKCYSDCKPHGKPHGRLQLYIPAKLDFVAPTSRLSNSLIADISSMLPAIPNIKSIVHKAGGRAVPRPHVATTRSVDLPRFRIHSHPPARQHPQPKLRLIARNFYN